LRSRQISHRQNGPNQEHSPLPAQGNTVPYTVKPGDTLSDIAASHGATITTLLAANPLCRGNPNLIHIGQILNLPSDAPWAQTPPAIAGVSDKALQLMLRFEVSGAQEYNLHYPSPSWPQGESGVTIGIGYDLDYVSASQFRADWGSRLQDDVIARLGAVCGITGAAAQSHIAGLSDVAVPLAGSRKHVPKPHHSGICVPDPTGAGQYPPAWSRQLRRAGLAGL
jgi:LysM repeat protein